MTTLSLVIVIVFITSYFFIAIESVTRVNKAAVALLMFVACWTLFMIDPSQYLPAAAGESIGNVVGSEMERHLGSTSTTLFFLMGAMTIVELVDQNGGFNFVRDWVKTRHKRILLWRVAFLTFLLSAILDNLTTSIVMIMILRKLIPEQNDRFKYAALVIIAANSGGAFSPIGDVTTIMLWNKGVITAAGVMTELLLPSLVSMVVPAYIISLSLKGTMDISEIRKDNTDDEDLTTGQRKAVFYIGVGGLVFVPIFKTLKHLPPFVGILLVLGLLWTITEIFYRKLPETNNNRKGTMKRVITMLKRIDMSTILFFLGILMSVACLETIGVLTQMGHGLNDTFNSNHYAVTGIIGVLSSIVDNVPLVAGCMGMYPVEAAGNMAVDGIFWQLLAYCAGVGGSILIVGSAAGVVVMGLEKISFGWYMKHISWIAFAGYIAGMLCYRAEHLLLF